MRHLAVLLSVLLAACAAPSESRPLQTPSVTSLLPSATGPEQERPREIVFVKESTGVPMLFLTDAAGSMNPAPLAQGAAPPATVADYAPAWSPDGLLVAHHRLTSEGSDLLVVVDGVTGEEVASVEVGFPPAGAADVSWSPGSDRIAYWSTGEPSNEIRVLEVASQETTILAGDPAADRYPAWSPSGGHIAFWSDRSGRGELWLMDEDGIDATAVADVGLAMAPASWSPDGSQLAVARQVGPSSWQTEILSPAGEPLAALPAAGSSVNAAWSPDGLRLAYWDVSDSRALLLVMDADGGQPRQLGPLTGTASGTVLAVHPSAAWPPPPSWSPDGDQLVAELRQPDGSAVLLVASVDSGEWHVLEGIGGNAYSPAWQPRQP